MVIMMKLRRETRALVEGAATLAALVGLAALGACVHGPDYVKPTATTATAPAPAASPAATAPAGVAPEDDAHGATPKTSAAPKTSATPSAAARLAAAAARG